MDNSLLAKEGKAARALSAMRNAVKGFFLEEEVLDYLWNLEFDTYTAKDEEKSVELEPFWDYLSPKLQGHLVRTIKAVRSLKIAEAQAETEARNQFCYEHYWTE